MAYLFIGTILTVCLCFHKPRVLRSMCKMYQKYDAPVELLAFFVYSLLMPIIFIALLSVSVATVLVSMLECNNLDDSVSFSEVWHKTLNEALDILGFDEE